MKKNKYQAQSEQRFGGPMVVVGENENLESAIRRFKKVVDEEGIIKTYREKQYFMKPSMKRRLKEKEARRKEKQRQAITEKKLNYASNVK